MKTMKTDMTEMRMSWQDFLAAGAFSEEEFL